MAISTNLKDRSNTKSSTYLPRRTIRLVHLANINTDVLALSGDRQEEGGDQEGGEAKHGVLIC